MAQRLSKLDQWMRGTWADRDTINQNATELEIVGDTVEALKAQVQRQQQELLQLRAMLMGVVEVLHAKLPFDDAALAQATHAAHAELTKPVPRAAQTAVCMKCGSTVPVASTIVTGDGIVCDACSR